MRNNKGITLIALVITIIVMLILVAVTITMAVNGGLFTHAGKAAGDTQNAIDAEQELANLAPGMSTDQLIAKYTTGQGGNGGGVTLTWTHTDTDDDGVLDVGEVVTASDGESLSESFYVIATPGANDTTVKLLAMYNLKKDTNGNILSEQDTTGANNTCAFSSTNYWPSETSYPVNLNDYTIPEGATSIITTAKTYGSSLGGTGRLMTKEELEALGASGYYTSGCPSFINDQNFWLGTTYDGNDPNNQTGSAPRLLCVESSGERKSSGYLLLAI